MFLNLTVGNHVTLLIPRIFENPDLTVPVDSPAISVAIHRSRIFFALKFTSTASAVSAVEWRANPRDQVVGGGDNLSKLRITDLVGCEARKRTVVIGVAVAQTNGEAIAIWRRSKSWWRRWRRGRRSCGLGGNGGGRWLICSRHSGW